MESFAIEPGPRLDRPTELSNRRVAEARTTKLWVAAQSPSTVSHLPASCRPEYKRPASLLQMCGCRLGSVSFVSPLLVVSCQWFVELPLRVTTDNGQLTIFKPI